MKDPGEGLYVSLNASIYKLARLSAGLVFECLEQQTEKTIQLLLLVYVKNQ